MSTGQAICGMLGTFAAGGIFGLVLGLAIGGHDSTPRPDAGPPCPSVLNAQHLGTVECVLDAGHDGEHLAYDIAGKLRTW